MVNQSPLDPVPLLFYDGLTILDPETHRYYRCLADRGYGHCGGVGDSGNSVALQWCSGLALSELLPGETDPPDGQVGQYGRYGCVLSEGIYGVHDYVADVVLFPYNLEDAGRFLREIKETTGTRFQPGSVDIWTVSCLHLLSLFDPWPGDEGDGAVRDHRRGPSGRLIVTDGDLIGDTEIATDVVAAMAWGRAHAARLSNTNSRLERLG